MISQELGEIELPRECGGEPKWEAKAIQRAARPENGGHLCDDPDRECEIGRRGHQARNFSADERDRPVHPRLVVALGMAGKGVRA